MFFGHSFDKTSQSRKSVSGILLLNKDQIQGGERQGLSGNPKCLESCYLVPLSGRLMSVCCQVVLHKMMLKPCRSSDISSPPGCSLTGNYIAIINGLPVDPRAIVTLSLCSAISYLQRTRQFGASTAERIFISQYSKQWIGGIPEY